MQYTYFCLSFLMYIARSDCRREQTVSRHDTMKGQHFSLGKGWNFIDWGNRKLLSMLYRSLSASKVIHVRILGQKNYLSKVWFMHPLAAFCFVFQNWWKALLVSSTVYNFIFEKHSFCFCFLKDVWSFLGTSFILSCSHPISVRWMMVLVSES